MSLNDFVDNINSVLFSDYTVYALIAVGLLFTVWSFFGQYRALSHGSAVIRGKYDDKDDPGAINHFQALSAALSATVGLGNIGGVALAVALGGPGAVLWMWLIGLLGMSLKMTEVTQSMIFRNTQDPENPHGGPMFVVSKGLKESPGLRVFAGILFFLVATGLTLLAANAFGSWIAYIPGMAFALVFLVLGFIRGTALGIFIGGAFVVTLLISAITGGNMFQAWNVADITNTYFGIPQIVTGIILAVVVGLVIIGGIKRIGNVAGRIVPFMCAVYVLAALYVLVSNIQEVPEMFMLIIRSGLPDFLGGESPDATGAFLGGTFAYAAMWGVKRALFSSEAGQGSSPIAHSAAKTDEPVREGVVAGLEPFIDTIVVCTLTALVILSSGAYDREAEARFPSVEDVQIVAATDPQTGEPIENTWTVDTPPLPVKTPNARRILQTSEGRAGWSGDENIFLVVRADEDTDTGRDLRRISGTVSRVETEESSQTQWVANWKTLESETKPRLRELDPEESQTLSADTGIYVDYAGASLTAHAFDRVEPGLGMWLISAAAWLFAVSTMISWSYYGEQGIYYLCGWFSESATKSIVVGYKIVYCLLIIVTTWLAMPIITQSDGSKSAIIGTDAELDMWTTLGLGVMLVVNIPIMIVFGRKAMQTYHEYIGRLKRGELDPHAAPEITDVVEGHDVE